MKKAVLIVVCFCFLLSGCSKSQREVDDYIDQSTGIQTVYR